jgi:hypothetical protein
MSWNLESKLSQQLETKLHQAEEREGLGDVQSQNFARGVVCRDAEVTL